MKNRRKNGVFEAIRMRRDPPPSHSGDHPVCGGIGGGVSGAAAAAGLHHRRADGRASADIPCGASLFRQSGAGRDTLLGAGEPAGTLRPENDPRPAL